MKRLMKNSFWGIMQLTQTLELSVIGVVNVCFSHLMKATVTVCVRGEAVRTLIVMLFRSAVDIKS